MIVTIFIYILLFLIVASETVLIIFLVRSRRKRAAIRSALEESLRQKDLLLKEIHHRLKNNLNMVGNIIRLQALGEEDPQVQEKFYEIVSRLTSIGMIHEHLYTSSDFMHVSFPEYIGSLVEALHQSLTPGEIKTDISIENLSLQAKHAIPLALIITELITNAFKHGFPGSETGHIRISLHTSEEILTLEVSNNGRPLPEEFSVHNTASLGFQIIHNLVQQLDGDLLVTSKKNPAFLVKIPWREEAGPDVPASVDRTSQRAV